MGRLNTSSTILPGIVIGEYAFIGAGSVVTKDVEPFSLLYGNPATQRGFITAEGIILDMEKKDANGIEHKLKT
jgi:UDP-2-acetamido-3-amino-2,3-dideoxy-glucuronate N-acetyltransferase